jgi:3-dehydroquinate synthase
VTEGVVLAPGILGALGDHVRAAAPAHRYALITDETVGAHYAERAVASFGETAVDVLRVPPGEATKTRETWGTLTDRLLAAGYGRDSALVALGGGMITDLAGFVAATFMRGIPVVHVPTTLLAMIDAALGGKTGVDTPAGKNLVGAFHDPATVVIDPLVLATLPPRELRAGLAEALKHGVIADARYFELVVAALPILLAPGGAATPAMTEVIAGSIAIKTDVVRRDAREAGVRRILNFGHTIGHAAESLSGYALLHGEAVAIGMAVESRLAERTGIAAVGTAARIADALAKAGLPTTVPATLAPEAVLTLTHGDKKRRAGRVEYALPSDVGTMAPGRGDWGVAIDDDDVRAALTGA